MRPLVEEAEWLKGVIAYVKAHYAERITVADAAAVSGYSPSHFMRIFRQEAGQTFVDFLTDYRLSAAVYYLKETRDEIGVVARDRRGGGELRLCQPVLFHTPLQSEVRRVPRTIPTPLIQVFF